MKGFLFLKKHIVKLLLLSSCIFWLSACNQPQAKKENQVYSLTAQAIESAPFSSTKYDLSFLRNQTLTITSTCWLDANRLLCLAANPSQNFSEEEANPSKSIVLFILYTGDSTLELIYQGEHPVGKLQKLSNNQVAVVGVSSLLLFDYSTQQVVEEILLGEERSDRQGADSNVIDGDVVDQSCINNMVFSPNGKYIAYGDDVGSIMIADRNNSNIKTITAESLGYNWLSNPLWSNDSKNVVFFCGYQPYSYDNIAIGKVSAPDGSMLLNYDKVADSFPFWPNVGNGLIVLENFINNPDQLPKKMSLIQTDTGKVKKAYNLEVFPPFTDLFYANTASAISYLGHEGTLYYGKGDKFQALSFAPDVLAYPDTFSVDEKGHSVGILVFDQEGNIQDIYVLKNPDTTT